MRSLGVCRRTQTTVTARHAVLSFRRCFLMRRYADHAGLEGALSDAAAFIDLLRRKVAVRTVTHSCAALHRLLRSCAASTCSLAALCKVSAPVVHELRLAPCD